MWIVVWIRRQRINWRILFFHFAPRLTHKKQTENYRSIFVGHFVLHLTSTSIQWKLRKQHKTWMRMRHRPLSFSCNLSFSVVSIFQFLSFQRTTRAIEQFFFFFRASVNGRWRWTNSIRTWFISAVTWVRHIEKFNSKINLLLHRSHSVFCYSISFWIWFEFVERVACRNWQIRFDRGQFVVVFCSFLSKCDEMCDACWPDSDSVHAH